MEEAPKTDLILAVGGGSCCDYAKAVSVSVNCDDVIGGIVAVLSLRNALWIEEIQEIC